MVENPLYEYSAIVDRPFRPLPGNARVAVWVGVNVEHYAFGRPALSLVREMPFSAPDSLNYGWREYGSRVGIFRLLERMQDVGVRGTAIVNSEVPRRHRSATRRIQDSGWAWVAHGRDNSTLQKDMSIEEERAYLIEVTEDLERSLGVRPRGWLGPARVSTLATNDLLAELGYDYALDWSNDDQVYDYTVATGRLACIPYSVEVNDIVAYVLHGQTAAQFHDTIVDHFSELYDTGDRWPAVLGLSIHPFLSGQPSKVRALTDALQAMAEREDVWMATSDEIVDWYYGGSR
jgi:peptidoglycan/xylan/chitin deacetylase (PgdA/CDA1 family)